MGEKWILKNEIERFTEFWNNKPSSVKRHTRECWDIRAEDWESGLQNNKNQKESSDRRILATADFLRQQGLLGKQDEVIDIGCGPGRFAAEFAKTASHVVGTDLSPRMLQYAAQFSASQGIDNVSFVACDFKEADIDELGWRNRFDLVFSYITPAISNKVEFEKAMAMSRGWCFNGSFLDVSNSLYTDVSRKLFHKEPGLSWDGRTVYALFNILWLQGFCPYVTYYMDKGTETVRANMLTAERIAENIGIVYNETDKIQDIYRYVMENADADGNLIHTVEKKYVWMLWDTRVQLNRDSYER